jgi:hypothetical protein
MRPEYDSELLVPRFFNFLIAADGDRNLKPQAFSKLSGFARAQVLHGLACLTIPEIRGTV